MRAAQPGADAATSAPADTRAADGSRETHFLRGALLRQWAAIDCLTRQPEWNGQVLIVQGSGIGGGLAMAAAGLDDRVTLCAAWSPAMCDLAATAPNRAGWPHAAGGRGAEAPALDESSRQAARYFDAANFAPRVRCETALTTDLTSLTSPIAGVFAAYNAVPATGAKKQVFRGEPAQRTKATDPSPLDVIVRKHATTPRPRPARAATQPAPR